MKRLIFALLITLSCTLSFAQEGLFFSASKLSSSLITVIEQDARGLLWIGTEHGLNRFDGYHFHNYTSLNPDDQRPCFVVSLLTDSKGQLWVGTARGLLRYDESTDAFLPVSFPGQIEPRVSALLEADDGRLLAGTSGYGLYVISSDEMAATPLFGMAPENDDHYFNLLYQSKDKAIWKGGADWKITSRSAQGKLGVIVPEAGLVVDFFRRQGTDYALCQHGFLQLTPPNQQPLENTVPAASRLFSAVAADAQGNIYIGTRGEGLFWIPAGERKLRALPVLTAGVDIAKTNISTLFLDRNGNLWAGCQQKGLLMVPLRHRPLFNTWSFAAQQQQTASSVASIALGSDSIIWCAVPGDGVYGFNHDGFIIHHNRTPQDAESIICDDEGQIWLGTTDALYRIQPAQGRHELVAYLPSNRVNTMLDMGQGLLAVSTFSTGLCLVEKATGKVVRHLSMNDRDTLNHGNLVNDWIYTFDKDQEGNLWIGTASGVCCYNAERNTFHVKPERLFDRDACTALRVLSNGDVLMGFEHGLFRWNAQEGMKAEEGTESLRGRSIFYITEDRHHDIWLSTNDGLWQWSPDTQELTPYIGGGLASSEFVIGAGLQTADGALLLGTNDGVTLFHPDSLRSRTLPAMEVQLTALVIGNERAHIGTRSNGHQVMDSALYDCHHFRLSYIDASFQLEFSLLRFYDANDVTFEYRFKGEERWQSAEHGNNAIAFNHLSEGKHELEVRAVLANTHGPITTYVIEVMPPWWRSTWAYVVYIIIILTFLGGSIYMYQRHIEQQHDREKLHLLLSAINAENTPLTLDEMKRAMNSYVQSRKNKHGVYSDIEAMAERVEVPEQRGNDELLMDRIMQSINRHLGDSDFTVEQLCAEAAISRAHLHRKMKELTGLPVTEFIRNIRLEQAARLLREQKLNVTQVAYTVGFSSLGYFATVFRKHFGVAPRDYATKNDE